MYRIAKWNDVFENAWTRKRNRLGWFNCPSGNDSAGYIALMSYGDKGVAAIGVFTAICQWSATCLPLVRGSCARSDGRPLNLTQLALLIRMPERVVSESISLLTSEEVGWMTCDSDTETAQKPQETTNLPPVCQSSATSLPVACHENPLKVKGKKRKVKGEKETAIAVIAANADPPATIPEIVIPYEQVRDEFDRAFGLSSRMTDKRRAALKARWNDEWWRDNWIHAIDRGAVSAFLKGANDRGWIIDLEFFLRPDTATKILEGKYDDRQQFSRPPATSAAAREQRNANAFEALAAAADAADAEDAAQRSLPF